MGRKKRRKRESKKAYCFIVEGHTEENYINQLKKIYSKSGKVKNCGGGNARGVLNAAQKFISKYKDAYLGYVIWFDSDRYLPSKDANLKKSLEANKDVAVYISEPCVETWLLAHFQPIKSKNRDCNFYQKQLKKHIPTYHKNKPRLLEKYIDETRINTAIVNYPTIGKIPQTYFKEESK